MLVSGLFPRAVFSSDHRDDNEASCILRPARLFRSLTAFRSAMACLGEKTPTVGREDVEDACSNDASPSGSTALSSRLLLSEPVESRLSRRGRITSPDARHHSWLTTKSSGRPSQRLPGIIDEILNHTEAQTGKVPTLPASPDSQLDASLERNLEFAKNDLLHGGSASETEKLDHDPIPHPKLVDNTNVPTPRLLQTTNTPVTPNSSNAICVSITSSNVTPSSSAKILQTSGPSRPTESNQASRRLVLSLLTDQRAPASTNTTGKTCQSNLAGILNPSSEVHSESTAYSQGSFEVVKTKGKREEHDSSCEQHEEDSDDGADGDDEEEEEETEEDEEDEDEGEEQEEEAPYYFVAGHFDAIRQCVTHWDPDVAKALHLT
ncbi:unnamed protein product [Protopolystoma xenopodis]|uniref:Uncharacterized protein n=1 Tax=Protopolystoma xenopodis TaxID=117903 RepID=A0A448WIG4_9PLAT|nr:unnamed protein product [Protopolystoma xenopodis]